MSPAFTIDWRVQRPAIVVAAIVCGALAWWHRGDVIAWIGLLFLLFPVVLVCLIATGLWLLFDRSRTTHGSARLAGAGLIIAGGAAGSIVPGWIIGRIDLKRAEDWAETLAPNIEQYREQHGVYPASLNEVTNFEDAPRLARRGGLDYHAGVDRFYLYLPIGFMDDIHWSSAQRVWTKEKMQ